MSTEETEHSEFGGRIKGAAHVVHGIGENIRGTVLGAAESMSGSEAAKEKKEKNEEIAAKGRAEMERGMAQMKGVSPPTGATKEAQPAAPTETQSQAQEPAEGPVEKPTEGSPPSQASTQEPVSTEGSQAPEPETTQQAAKEQTEISKETQEAPATKESQTQSGKEGLIGTGADAPGGPGSCID